MALAHQAIDPAHWPVLDIGAGGGRNALALARRGHPRGCPGAEQPAGPDPAQPGQPGELAPAGVGGGFVHPRADLRRDYQLVVLSGVVSDFRARQSCGRCWSWPRLALARDGQLLFSIFLAHGGYEPDAAARQLGQQLYSRPLHPPGAGGGGGQPAPGAGE
jgi:hypothetical protein